jgi:GNAT superfamily N-acetyltransferase
LSATVIVRRADVTDAPAIAAVHVASWRAAYRGIVPQAFLDGLDVERRAAFWTQRLTDEDGGESRSWVAELGGQIVGFAGTGPADADDVSQMPAGSHELQTMYSLQETWGTGVGRALLDRVFADLAADGVATMHLWVFAANDRARRFYERAGWTADGESRELPIGGVDLPIARYRRTLARGEEAST